MNLEKYRRMLMAKQQDVLADLNRTGISGSEKPEAGELDLVDESVLSERKEDRFSQADHDSKLLNEIQDALRRIADGTFGQCLEDRKRIDETRLKAVPWTRYCLKHQKIHDRTAENKQLTL